MFEKKMVNGVEVIELSNAYGKAEVATLGAHVLRSEETRLNSSHSRVSRMPSSA